MMKLVKLFVESVCARSLLQAFMKPWLIVLFQGTSAIHLEDQLHGGKKVQRPNLSLFSGY